jgi:hypothetical protein
MLQAIHGDLPTATVRGQGHNYILESNGRRPMASSLAKKRPG